MTLMANTEGWDEFICFRKATLACRHESASTRFGWPEVDSAGAWEIGFKEPNVPECRIYIRKKDGGEWPIRGISVPKA